MTCTCSQCVAGRNGDIAAIGQGLDTMRMQGLQQGIDLYRSFNRFGPSRVMTD